MIKIKHTLTIDRHTNFTNTAIHTTDYSIYFTVGNNTLISSVNVFKHGYGYEELDNWLPEDKRYAAYRYLIREKHKLIQAYISSNNLEFLCSK